MWLLNTPWQRLEETSGEASRLAAHYRREASRLVALAANSPSSDTKSDFLRLALHYEALATHAAQRSRRKN